MEIMFEEYDLTKEEEDYLATLTQTILEGELEQVRDLIRNCDNKYQFAKTHSVYMKDWEKTRGKMEHDLKQGKLPPGVGRNLHEAVMREADKIMEAKLETVREAFEMKFGESIHNYLGKDGKTKFLGLF
jgi:hypothetical protein